MEKIRAQYRADWKSKEMKKRQRSVALYFIDRVRVGVGAFWGPITALLKMVQATGPMETSLSSL